MLPAGYDDGLAADAAGHLLWSGVPDGLYRSNLELRPQLRLRGAIPGALRSDGFARRRRPGMGHDPAPGRLLVPLQCAAGAASAGCPAAGIGVYDAGLIWRYYVELDRSAITSIDWAQVSPDGSLVWTSSGRDLLFYFALNVEPAAPEALRPVERFAGVLPLTRVTGSAIWRGRLMLAGESEGHLQVWSLDIAQGRPADPRLELDRPYAGDPARPRGIRRARRAAAPGLRAGAQRTDVQGPGRLAAQLRPRRRGGARDDDRPPDAARRPPGDDHGARLPPLRRAHAPRARAPRARRALARASPAKTARPTCGSARGRPAR